MIGTDRILRLATQVYGSDQGAEVTRRIQLLLSEYRERLPQEKTRDLSERDTILIAYPDQLRAAGASSLSVLTDFAERHLAGFISAIHILPFYPWSSDDGFSVTDFRAVAAEYGTWGDVRRLGERFGLMLDAEINHASAHSEWFHLFLEGRVPYRDYFLQVQDSLDLTEVVRPRTTPLLTRFRSVGGELAVWTTFGADQVDLNYRSPALLLEMLDVLLFYVSQGAEYIRLDAVAYLWKEIGTTCINLPKTHMLVKLIRAAIDEVAAHVKLVAEANVPQADNLLYFGDGADEAHLIYNFALPPLVLDAFRRMLADALRRWIRELRVPAGPAAFLNILSTHDGIGLNPLRGILASHEIRGMVEQCNARGGLVSSKMNPDGTSSPYELNMNFFDALDVLGPSVDARLRIERFVTAHAIMLSLAGVPALYFHSLFGSRGWSEGVLRTGRSRSVNREKLDRDRLEAELADPGSERARVFRQLSRLLAVRNGCAAFSPKADQRVLPSSGPVLAIVRGGSRGLPGVLCLYNVGPENCQFQVADPALPAELPAPLRDLITGEVLPDGNRRSIVLAPYQSLWLSLDVPE